MTKSFQPRPFVVAPLAAAVLAIGLGCDKGNPNEPFPGAKQLTLCSTEATDVCLLAWPSAAAVASLPARDTIYELGVRFRVFAKSTADSLVGHVDPGTSSEVTFGTKTAGGPPVAVYSDSGGGRVYEMRTFLTPGEHNLAVSVPASSTWGLRVYVSVADVPYSATLLPRGQASDADALALNSAGDAAGWTLDGRGARQPALWRAGSLTPLAYASSDSGTATSINDAGVVVGIVRVGGDTGCTWMPYRPVLWRPNSAAIQLGSSCAYMVPRINNLGHAVVTGDSVRLFASDGSVLPLVYPCGSSCRAWGNWRAYQLNDRDQIVGTATDELAVADVAVSWGVKLAWLAPWYWISPHGSSRFVAVNDSSQALGNSDIYFISTLDAAPIDLVGFGPGVVPIALNNSGTALGFNSTNNTVYLWQHRHTRRVTLPSGWLLDHVSAINDAGQIVGHGTSPSGQRGPVLLTPTAP